jgi:hypothetical protein
MQQERWNERNSCRYFMLVFWVIKTCGLEDRYQRFRGTYCLHLQGWSEDKGMSIIGEISRSHGSEYEDDCFLGCRDVLSGRSLHLCSKLIVGVHKKCYEVCCRLHTPTASHTPVSPETLTFLCIGTFMRGNNSVWRAIRRSWCEPRWGRVTTTALQPEFASRRHKTESSWWNNDSK